MKKIDIYLFIIISFLQTQTTNITTHTYIIFDYKYIVLDKPIYIYNCILLSTGSSNIVPGLNMFYTSVLSKMGCGHYVSCVSSYFCTFIAFNHTLQLCEPQFYTIIFVFLLFFIINTIHGVLMRIEV